MALSKISGLVKSADLCQPIKGTLVLGKDRLGNLLAKGKTNKNGYFSLKADPNLDAISFSHPAYVTKEIRFTNNFPHLVRLMNLKLIGYAEKLWFVPGEKISCYVHSVSRFKAQLFRCGLSISKVLEIGEFQPIFQQVPDGFFVSNNLSWKEPITFVLPRQAEPGLYNAKLSSLDNNDEYNITFVLSTSPENYGEQAKLLVISSTNTWQTYNIWGGRSRYRNFEIEKMKSIKEAVFSFFVKHMPEAWKQFLRSRFARKFVVSIKDHPEAWEFLPLALGRPHPNASINGNNVYSTFTSHLAEGEWRVLAWLEREKIAYDLVSGFELHQNPALLMNYKAVLLNTHCEYWTQPMYLGLKRFHAKGGVILNLSGNSIYREVEFLAGGSLRCVSLKFHRSAEDESKLLGVRFNMNGYFTSAPYRVLQPDHWVFQHTKLQKNQLFAASSLNKPHLSGHGGYDPSQPGIKCHHGSNQDGGSGWETDKVTDTAPSDVLVLAKGTNPKNGGADMIIRDQRNSAGLVFSASSITFGGTLLIDEVTTKIVKNVIERALN